MILVKFIHHSHIGNDAHVVTLIILETFIANMTITDRALIAIKELVLAIPYMAYEEA